MGKYLSATLIVVMLAYLGVKYYNFAQPNVILNTPIKNLHNTSKIMLGAGPTQMSYNSTWITIDINKKVNPSIIADLTLEETWNILDGLKADIVLNEFPAGFIIHKGAAKLLNPGGILLSSLCVPFKKLNQTIQETKKQGFSKVYIFDWTMPPPHTLTIAQINTSEKSKIAYNKEWQIWTKWLKTSDATQIRNYFEKILQTHKEMPDHPGESSCHGPEPNSEWYSFIAFK